MVLKTIMARCIKDIHYNVNVINFMINYNQLYARKYNLTMI